MGLPAVAVLGLLSLTSTRKLSGLTRKTSICRLAAEEAKDVPAAKEDAKAAPVAKKAKPTPISGSEWKNEVNPELSHPSGLYVLPVEPAEPKGAYDYDNEYNQMPSETSVHAQESKCSHSAPQNDVLKQRSAEERSRCCIFPSCHGCIEGICCPLH